MRRKVTKAAALLSAVLMASSSVPYGVLIPYNVLAEEVSADAGAAVQEETAATVGSVTNIKTWDAAGLLAAATILIGNTDENGDYYACVKGYEEAVYLLSKESVNSLLELKPFNLILKIPALVNIDTLDSVDMSIGKKTYTMKLDDGNYKFGKKTVKKEKFTDLYQDLQGVMLDSEIEKIKDAADKEEVLSVIFHRNTEKAPEVTLKYYTYDDTYDSLEINGTERFLVKTEDVNALVKQIKKAF